MRWSLRVIAASVATTMALSVVPAAFAQQPTTPTTTQQPEVFRETLKTGPDEGAPGEVTFAPATYSVAAGVASAFLIPGRAITCVLGSGFGILTLAATLGTGYRFATYLMEEGCGGKWIVTGDDLRPDRPVSTSGPDTR